MPFITLLLLLVTLFSAACDKRNPPLIVSPTPPPPPASDLRVITRIQTDRDFIYADNNNTFARVSILVKDGDGFAVSGQAVAFKTNLGRVLTAVSTDSTGVATTTFWDDNEIGTATIEALVRNYSPDVADSILSEVTASITVDVIPVPSVDTIHFWELPTYSNGDKYLPLAVMQSVTVRTRVRDADGADVVDNTLITFIADKGDFVDSGGNILGDRAVVKTINGRASVTYNSGSSAGSGTITAAVYGQDGNPIAIDTASLVISPGRPAMIQLKSYVQTDTGETEAYTDPVNSNNTILMRATLWDAHSNFVPNTPVTFRTNLGTFMNTSQQTFNNTNANGVAQVRFTPGLQAGAATITATANGDTLLTQIIFHVSSDQIHSIGFTQAGQIDLNVANTGGTSSAVLRVQLKDINGNLVDTTQQVRFQILSQEMDANLNNQPPAAVVTVLSTGGEAQVSVNSGLLSGPITIRATCVTETATISATKSNIVVHAGPPATINPFIGGYNQGTNAGGGSWSIEAGAIVKDIYNNPVDYGTSVFFSMDLPPTMDPSNVTIVANGFTGNYNAVGDSTAGMAYTTLVYWGYYTFDTITIKARSGSFDPVTGNYLIQEGQSEVTLPLNEPSLEARAVPWHLDFSEEASWNNINSLTAEIWVSLHDGQGNPVHKAILLLLSNRGTFDFCSSWDETYYLPAPTFQYPNLADNRIQTARDGFALGRIRAWRYECLPPDQIMGPIPQDYRITVVLMGTLTEIGTDLIVSRYESLPFPPPNPPPAG